MNSKRKDFHLVIVLFLLIIFLFCGVFFKKMIILPYFIFIFFILKGYRKLSSPLIFLLIPWSFMFVIYFSNLITYHQSGVSYLPIIYILIGLILLLLGYLFGSKVTFNVSFRSSKESSKNNLSNLLLLINVCSFMGLIGSIFFAIDLIFITGIDLSTLSNMRESYTASNVSIFTQVGNLLAWGAFMGIPAIFFLWNETRFFSRILWITSILSYSGYSLLTAGRQVVFQIMIIFISCFMINTSLESHNTLSKRERKTENKRNKIILIIVVVAVILYCMHIATGRNNGLISNSKVDVLMYYFNFSLDNIINKILSIFPPNLKDGIVESLVYFTHQIPGFEIFWNIDDIGPFYGMYSMPFIDRRVASLGLTTWSVESKMNYVRSFMSSQGAMNVGWKTWFSYLIFDYGRIGALIYCFIYGIVVAKVYKNFKKNKTFISALLLIRINIGLFYTIMFPATCETGLLILLLFICFIHFLEKKYYLFKYKLRSD